MSTPHDNAAAFLQALDKMEFKPGAFDNTNRRQLVRKNKDGHTNLRITIDHEGEPRPHSISLIKTDGRNSQVTLWESRNMSARMPTKGLLALIKAA